MTQTDQSNKAGRGGKGGNIVLSPFCFTYHGHTTLLPQGSAITVIILTIALVGCTALLT